MEGEGVGELVKYGNVNVMQCQYTWGGEGGGGGGGGGGIPTKLKGYFGRDKPTEAPGKNDDY